MKRFYHTFVIFKSLYVSAYDTFRQFSLRNSAWYRFEVLHEIFVILKPTFSRENGDAISLKEECVSKLFDRTAIVDWKRRKFPID